MADIVFISPRFEVSFWGMEHSMPLLRKRANIPQACLALLAALTPEEHTVELCDENVEPLDFDRLAKADLVGITAMHCQGKRAREILTELKKRGVKCVVGGPLVTVEEGYFEGLADHIFIGEAEVTWPQFLTEWQQGLPQYRYEQLEKTDMTTVPVPRLDLLKLKHYMFGSMQISRGCPFQCEFCDIIVTFGRRPRLKNSDQVIAELNEFLRLGMKIVFVVDDNLVGNKKAIKPILRDIIEWQRERKYPLTFFTEASLDLAEDDELMQLIAEAGFQSVFIGIESPNEESLLETKKFQNVRAEAGTVMERIHRVQDQGIEVYCGMILGFDHDDTTVFDVMEPFIKEAGIVNALIGMLFAIPKTPLHARLKEDGRLDESEDLEYGTNVIPLLMSRDELRDGFVKVMNEVYDVDAYFDRIEDLFIKRRFQYVIDHLPFWKRNPFTWAKRHLMYYIRSAVLFQRIMSGIPERNLRQEYRRRTFRLLRARPMEPHIVFVQLIKLSMHYHYYKMVTAMLKSKPELVKTL